MDITKVTILADYFIICTGTSDRMIGALAKSVSEFLHGNYHLSVIKEGESWDGWILLDVGDVIVHIFSPDQREYYSLEDLWSQGKVLLRVQ